jgi:hypothetical protein
MAIKINIENTHAYCFPTKVLAGNGGSHILNIELTADADNGTIVSAGEYKSFDNYVEAEAPAGYEAKIVDVAADGNFYVEVVNPADAVLICEVIDNPYTNYDSRFKDSKLFYNAEGDVVRGYCLVKHDIYELSAEGFEGTPEVGKTVTVSGRKHVVA